MEPQCGPEEWLTTIHARIVVVGSFDPDAFTAAVSLAPTRTYREGDPRSPLLRFSHDGWRIDLGERRAMHLEEEADRLLAALAPIRETFRTTVESMGLSSIAAFGVFVEDRQCPSIGLRSDQIAQLAALGMELDVDVM